MDFLSWSSFFVAVVLTSLWLLINLFLIKRNIRTMWVGMTLIIAFAHFIGTIELLFLLLGPYITDIPALIILFLTILILGGFNTLVIIYLIINGIKLLKKEGASFANSLPLILATLLVLNEFIVTLNLNIPFFTEFRLLIFYVAAYFYFMLFVFIVACISFFYRQPKGRINYIIVHGAGLINNEITPLLASRVEAAISLFEKQDSDCKIIMSGGIGKGKKFSEAEVMKTYAIEKGIPENNILLENKSHTTEENLQYAEALIDIDKKTVNPQIAIVTSNYHIFRVLLIARKIKVNIHLNRGAKTARYYVPSAILREFVAVLKLHWKSSLLILIIFLIPYFLIIFINFIAISA